MDLILACDINNGIGKNNELPWKIKEDLKHFQNITSYTQFPTEKNVVIMGYKTWKSIGKPLKNRINIVISKNHSIDESEYVKQVRKIENVYKSLNSFSNIYKVFVIGGAQIYRYFLPHVDTIYLTKIYYKYECDVFIELENIKLIKDSQKIKVKDINNQNEIYIAYGIYKNTKKLQEYKYLNLVKKILIKGYPKSDRTGIGTLSIFGAKLTFNLKNNIIPLLTTKKVYWRGIVEELLWFIRGSTNSKELEDKKVNIWKGNSSKEFLKSRNLEHLSEGDIGAGYGFQWRHFGAEYIDCKTNYNGRGVDQLKNCIELIKKNPNSRRILLCSWNAYDLNKMCLPPCHCLVQFYIENYKLSCQMYQRSADIGLGVPFNIASYALLTHMISHICKLEVGKFIHIMGDTHIYLNHVVQLENQLKNTPEKFPQLIIKRNVKDIEDFKYEDFELINYNPKQGMKMKMAV